MSMNFKDICPCFDLIPVSLRSSDCNLSEEDLLVLELLRWFKGEFFSWVDCLPCNHCGGPTQSSGPLAPSTEDLRWGAQRVENHHCQACNHSTRFPRWVQ